MRSLAAPRRSESPSGLNENTCPAALLTRLAEVLDTVNRGGGGSLAGSWEGPHPCQIPAPCVLSPNHSLAVASTGPSLPPAWPVPLARAPQRCLERGPGGPWTTAQLSGQGLLFLQPGSRRVLPRACSSPLPN